MSFDEAVLTEEAAAPSVEEMTENEEELAEASVEEAPEETTEETTEETNEEAAEEEVGEQDEEKDTPDATEIAYLKAELESLKKELADTRSLYARLESECAEFSEVYPEVSLSSLPDSIWQSVKSGVPLAAAYALEARKAELAARRAGEVNVENRKMSSGSLSSDSYNDYFSPSQVRAMSAAEVRANYTKIVNSMSKWH